MKSASIGFRMDVRRFARCGFNHHHLWFEKFINPCGRATHFAICPTYDQPILMSEIKKRK